MAAEQTSKSSKHKLKFGGNEGKDSSKHDTSNHTPCCSLKSSTANESNKSLCSKLKNNSCFVEKQESKCCVLKQRKSELPKKQVVKKEIENVSVIPTLSTTEELSKAKKRRLRKKKVLAIYTGNKVQVDQAPLKVHLVKPEPIVKPNPIPESKEIKTEVPKILAKELRKRSEKTILEARKKKITTKSPPKDSPIIARKVIPVEPEACYTKLNHDSSKIVEPSLPRFYFPNNQSASWNGRSNIGNNSVFYFGETKNELEGLSAFKSFATVNNKYDEPKKDSRIYNFSSVKRKSEPISLNKFNQDENEFVNPARLFAVNQNQEGNNFDFFNPSNAFMVNQNQVQYSVQDTKLNFVNSSIATNIVKQIEPPSDNVDTNLIQVEPMNDNIDQHLIKIDPLSDNFVTERVNKKTMDSGDLAHSNKAGKSREEVLAEREAKKAAKLAAKNKHKAKLPEAAQDKPLQVETNVVDNLSNVDQTIPKLRRTVVDRAAKPRTTVMDGSTNLERSVDCVDGEIRGSKYSLKSSFGSCSPLDVPEVTDKVKRLVISSKVDGRNKQEKIETLIEVNKNSKGEMIDINKTEIIKDDKLSELNKDGKSKAELRAERRAKQEAQRAAKSSSAKELEKKTPQVEEIKLKIEIEKKVVSTAAKLPTHHKAKLFSHLYQAKKSNLALYQKLDTGDIHPAIIRLGSQYASRVVNGSNARCIALLNALKQMICDYKTPTEKEFSRGLEALLTPVTDYLNHCRPLSVSMTNALRHIKWHLTQLPNDVSDVQAQKKLCDIVDTYIREQIDVAGEAICNTVQKKIANGDVILTYGCSSLIYRILVESHRSGTKFRVVVVDAGPWLEGREMLRRLVDKGLQCSYVLISATSFIMREVSKVLLGAHALLANGYVMSRAGSSQVALLAHSFNVPVLVCCETHKFSERVQTDAFVYNELGDPEEFVPKEKWTNFSNLTPLTLAYDVTPPELVTAVVTELAILPCTSVPVILRIKPSESLM